MLSPAIDVIEIAKAALGARHDPLQGQLADAKGQAVDVLVINARSNAMKNGYSHRKSRSLKLPEAPDSFANPRADDVVFVASTSTKEQL